MMKRVVFLLALVACSKHEEPPSGAVAVGEDPHAAEADDVWIPQCASCHGRTGRADGPMATQLGVKVPDFTDGAWQKSVEDEELETAIAKGGGAVGKSGSMPPHPALSGEVVKALVAKIRAFGL
jgi:mono/diheme cytochrome c family protein